MTVEPSADRTLSDIIAAGGAGVRIVDFDDDTFRQTPEGPGVVQIGVHRQGALPQTNLDDFDILLSVNPDAPRPWVGLEADRLDAAISELRARAGRQPVATAIAAQVLRMGAQLSFEHALAVESIGYSLLLASAGFRAWRAATPLRARPAELQPRVLSSHERSVLRIRLSRPASRNAFDGRMRDELVEALEFAVRNPGITTVELSGAGAAFSAGGDLDEFGRAGDAGLAHLIRTLRSPARLVHRLGARVTARLHGACIGAGIEVPVAAARVVARPGTFFRLPEISMGLIPGAGGTASIPRRIGRQRACYMAISGADIELSTALAWGLVDAVEASP